LSAGSKRADDELQQFCTGKRASIDAPTLHSASPRGVRNLGTSDAVNSLSRNPGQTNGRDSNALTVVAAVSRALEQAGVRHEEIANFYDEALSGDYNRVLQTALRWITVV
jgi:hypothetical protein